MALSASILAMPGCSSTAPRAQEDLFVTRSTSRLPADVHRAIRQHVSQNGWLYIGDNTIKAGEIIQVRICDPKAAANIWSAGMQVSAMMPCGHLSIYREGGATKVTLLHPRFMSLLDPHPAVHELVSSVTGPFLAMLDDVSR